MARKKHHQRGYKPLGIPTPAVLKCENRDHTTMTTANNFVALHQSSCRGELRGHHPCLMGIIRRDLPIRPNERRPGINLLWLSVGWLWRLRSWLFVSRTGLDVCNEISRKHHRSNCDTATRQLERNIDGRPILRLLLQDSGDFCKVQNSRLSYQ